jgi:hypothetical protein
MLELTPEQQHALSQSGSELVRAVDPATMTHYVLLRADLYERLRVLFDAESDVADSYPAVERAFAEGWNDPKMDDYDRYEELKR